MRFSIATTIIVASSLASSLVSGALTPQERTAFELSAGPDPNYCQPCLEKAMHNHFPHACPKDINSDAANYRPSGATDTEERCVCVAFQDLFWMKADCSKECPYVHNNNTMKNFLPSSKIEGCDKWIDFETNQEKVIEGFAIKNPDHKPEVFEIVAPPQVAEGEDDPTDIGEDGRYKVSVSITTKESEAKAKEQEALDSDETKKDSEVKKDEL
ncbi:hypothetical protein BX616_006759 [Lobosporangium transversale]|nr:hypothetical protein BX616_006759 [Lobosporangium transversale]